MDTNVLDREKVDRFAEAVGHQAVEIKTTTVTHRELPVIRVALPAASSPVPETGVYDESVYDGGAIYEPFVIGESPLGMAALSDDAGATRFEAILRIISGGAFPALGRRETATPGERRQLRDAMILEAHSRDGRDVFVSDDRKAFIGRAGERREALEALCGTRILTVDEFCDLLASSAD